MKVLDGSRCERNSCPGGRSVAYRSPFALALGFEDESRCELGSFPGGTGSSATELRVASEIERRRATLWAGSISGRTSELMQPAEVRKIVVFNNCVRLAKPNPSKSKGS